MLSGRVLQYLIQKVEETGIGNNVTLCVKGSVIIENMNIN